MSRARHLITVQDVKHRAFFGNTSMESEMGLLMAGQAMVSARIGGRGRTELLDGWNRDKEGHCGQRAFDWEGLPWRGHSWGGTAVTRSSLV